MIPVNEVRKLEILIGEVWIPVQLGQITEGDIIRQFEPDGRPVLVYGHHHLLVTERPFTVIEPYIDGAS